jgi:hypothetical protein
MKNLSFHCSFLQNICVNGEVEEENYDGLSALSRFFFYLQPLAGRALPAFDFFLNHRELFHGFSHFYSTIFDPAQLNVALNARCLPGLSLSLGCRHRGSHRSANLPYHAFPRQRASTSFVHKSYGANSWRFAESQARITRQNNSKPLYQQHAQVLTLSASITASNSEQTSTSFLLESQMQSIAVVYSSIWHSHF